MTIARAESAHVKPTFADLLNRRRGLVAADGVIEWLRDHPGHDPHLFRLRSDEPFASAGRWDV